MRRTLLRAHVHTTTAAIALAERAAAPHRSHEQPHRNGAVEQQPGRPGRRGRRGRRDVGQATTEYALVMLGAAAVALLVVTWATAGGGAGRIGRLFDRVIDAVLGRV
jgi:hypothetical protein